MQSILNIYYFAKYLFADIECGLPASIPNGAYELINGSVGYLSTVVYSCNDGYEMIGRAMLTCDIDERWNGPPPKCEGKWFTFILSPSLQSNTRELQFSQNDDKSNWIHYFFCPSKFSYWVRRTAGDLWKCQNHCNKWNILWCTSWNLVSARP